MVCPRFGSLSEYDLILSPTTPVSPFAWTNLYADPIEKQVNYYRWLALTYVVTQTTHPAIAVPCGTDDAGMPFGLQVTGRFHGDLQTLSAARAMEAAFATSPALRRPVPDLASLKPAQPALRSIVTAPPSAGAAQQGGGVSAV